MYFYRWRLIFGVISIVLGSVWLWNNLDIGPNIPLGSLWPLLLIILGLYIILRQTVWAGQPGGSVMVDRIIGDIRLGGPNWQAGDKEVFSLIGDVDIDLRQTALPDGETTLRVRSIIGDVDVLVPAAVGVLVNASVMIGDVRALGQRRDGFFLDLSQSTPDYASAERKVRIEIDMVIGDAEVERVA